MKKSGPLWLILWVTLVCAHVSLGLRFTQSPVNLTVTHGNPARLECSVEGGSELEISWEKNGKKLSSIDQTDLSVDQNHWKSLYHMKSVQQADAGMYVCVSEAAGVTVSSEPAWITVEGVPHFVTEPQDVAVLPGVTFNLSCRAVGPPDPVQLVWWQKGVQLGGPHPSPYTLTVPGLTQSSEFYCEAKNQKGVSTSRTATVNIKALPGPPQELQVTRVQEDNVTLSWRPGPDGHSPLRDCTIQFAENSGKREELFERQVSVPPHEQTIGGLRCFSNYSTRIVCSNEVGSSPFTDWVDFETLESVPGAAPLNFSLEVTGGSLLLSWGAPFRGELNGVLQEYRVEWGRPGEVKQDTLLLTQTRVNLSLAGGQFYNASFRVSACNSAGCGPWSQALLVGPQEGVSVAVTRSRLWVLLILAVLLAAVVLGGLALLLLLRRKKETQFGAVFEPVLLGAEPAVSYRAARSFNRQGPEPSDSTLDCLGISDELKEKLQDVLIQERWLSLGRLLGKGEFGSVREANLKREDGSVKRVAVKVLQSDVNSSADIEQCLREAAHMKDFDHPNVIKLIGVSLQSRTPQRLPVPMVILPFMKHGDLHHYLLMSRLGAAPFTLSLPTLVQFMLDIARGMDYLSHKNFIHRDLAARNCMLGEDMSVCVADFGLSKRIYSGDYYRQGSASKLPVKWIGLESLADNVYTTQSDVWSFGVTMWEIVTLGQTPYPGVENCEVYEYLLKGSRLKQPPGCLDEVFEIMHSCWNANPKGRPSFHSLIGQLEEVWAGLDSKELLYVNLGEGQGEESCGGQGAEGGAEGGGVPWQCEKGEGGGAEGQGVSCLKDSLGAAAATGGDYRYIMDPRGSLEDDGQSGASRACPLLQEAAEKGREEEEGEDTIINM
ncbi:tyrosine-protein kinase receptor TYRO3-like isoform X2 [Acipenser oxyrinchus oxyrinchus]|uniref:Tyrosine-protein kinase receptor TYRO3 n=1 Tax=Acipenser oxyrinchus oxyrinchus TaxID=40147 RepID=A0AAD8CWC5_ACIOX|nr:tyrosine-protein kinase receptor TYRO3-like isoform X2 [Acipenser oxyrinchus oxyrinchus]